MARYYFVRHGVTDWIEAGITAGSSDRPLSSFGLEQAQLTGQVFKDIEACRLFSSPMKRAIQTTQPISISTGLEPELINVLKEKDQGWFEGKRDLWRVIRKVKPLLVFWRPIYHFMVSMTGETQLDFEKRVLDAWKYIRSQEADKPVIVVAHSGILLTILVHEFGKNILDFERFFPDTCSITEIVFDGEGHARLVRLNDSSHLNGRTGI